MTWEHSTDKHRCQKLGNYFGVQKINKMVKLMVLSLHCKMEVAIC